MIRVLLADDQELVRTGFRLVLRREPGIEVVGEAGDGREALGMLEETEVDVVVMDVRMPRMDGIEATRRICARGGPRVLILTTFDLDEYVYGAVKAGASGFLLKDTKPQSLIEAIRTVAAGEMLFAPTVTRRLVEAYTGDRARSSPAPEGRLDALTAREAEVLCMVGRALSNGEIASELCVSQATVKTHLNRVMTKLGLSSRAQAVALAYETGLVTPHRD
ncbi:response regulator [Planomonospora algeriensis]